MSCPARLPRLYPRQTVDPSVALNREHHPSAPQSPIRALRASSLQPCPPSHAAFVPPSSYQIIVPSLAYRHGRFSLLTGLKRAQGPACGTTGSHDTDSPSLAAGPVQVQQPPTCRPPCVTLGKVICIHLAFRCPRHDQHPQPLLCRFTSKPLRRRPHPATEGNERRQSCSRHHHHHARHARSLASAEQHFRGQRLPATATSLDTARPN